MAGPSRIVARFAEYCGLGATEKSWLEQKLLEAAGLPRSAAGQLAAGQPDFPSPQELDAFDQVLRNLLAGKPGGTRSERAILRAKLARGCLRGVEQDELYLTDETILAAVDTLYAEGAFEPDDAHHLATFLGLFRGGPNSPHAERLATVCEELLWLDGLSEVQRADLVLAIIACHDLPLAVRSQALQVAVSTDYLPAEVGREILERAVRGSNLYRPYWWEAEGDFLDARAGWAPPESEEQRQSLVAGLEDLAQRLTADSRQRSRAELDDLDEALDWIESEEGSELLEGLAFQAAERLPKLMASHMDGEEGDEGFHPCLPPLHHPALEVLETDVHAAAEIRGSPRKCAELLVTALDLIVDDLEESDVDPAAFAAGILSGDSKVEAALLDSCAHVLDCTLPDTVDRIYVPLSQISDLSDDDLARIRELVLAVRDHLLKRDETGLPPELVEFLAPFEGRTSARLNKFAHEDLTFLASRLLEQAGLPRDEVAKAAAAGWQADSLTLAGPDLEWAQQLVSDYSDLFAPELVAAIRTGAGSASEPTGKYN